MMMMMMMMMKTQVNAKVVQNVCAAFVSMCHQLKVHVKAVGNASSLS